MTPSNKSMPDVLVIGAGAAGLIAAKKLHESGSQVKILEARNRMGGRIWTDRSHALPIELGPEFIHGKPQEIFDLLKTYQLETVERSFESFYKIGKNFSSFTETSSFIEKLHQQIDPLQKLSYADFLKKAAATPLQKKIARSYVEGFHAADPDLISTEAVLAAEQENHGENFSLRNGYDSLINSLASSIPSSFFELENIVTKVEWSHHNVTVRTKTPHGAKEYQAAQLIITLPLGILKASRGDGTVRFDPPLLCKQEALACLHMGKAFKVIVVTRNRFWEKQKTFSFLIDRDAKIPAWWTQEPSKSNILTGWLAGPSAQKIFSLKKNELNDLIIDSLSATFSIDKKNLPPLIEEIYWHNWSDDPFSRGAYSYPGIDGLVAARTLAEPVDDTLFFAGEATDDKGNYGTVHGALASGLRAAEEILKKNS